MHTRPSPAHFDLAHITWCLYCADLLIKMATEALKASASPEKQAAFTDCVRDALAGPSSGAGGGVAVALQGLQGFISGNG